MTTAPEVLAIKPGSSRVPTLVGREREWHNLTARCAQAHQGQGGVIWLVGEAGIGKTALMQQVRAWAEANGFQTLWGRHLNHGQAPPLHGLREALAQLFALSLNDAPENFVQKITAALEMRWPALQLRRRTLVQLLQPPIMPPQALFGAKEEQTEEAAHTSLYYLIFRLLSAAAQEKPLLLFLDDLHWADAITLDILAYLGPLLADQPVLLLGAYRPEEPDTSWKKLESLTLEQPAECWVLPRLGLDEVERMVARYDLGCEQAFCRQLFQVTEGVPLFVEQWLLSCRSEQDLSPALALFRTPPLVTQVIQRRLHRLSAEELRVLRIAAVIGEKFSVETLVQIHGQPLALLLELLGGLEEEHHLIRPTAPSAADTAFSFYHVLIRQVLYQAIPLALRQQWHQQAGQALEPLLKSQPERVFEVAHHFLAGQQREGAVEVLLQAGQRAMGLKAYAEAREYFQQATEAAETAEQKAAAQEWLGDAHWELRHSEDARACWERSLPLQAVPLRRAMLYWKLNQEIRGDLSRQRHLLQLALNETRAHPQSIERAQILLTLANYPDPKMKNMAQRQAHLVHCSAQALRILRHHPEQPLLPGTLIGLTCMRDRRIVNLGRARRLLRRAIRLAERQEDWEKVILGYLYLAEGYRGTNLREACRELEEALRLTLIYFPPDHKLKFSLLRSLFKYGLAVGDEKVQAKALGYLQAPESGENLIGLLWRQHPEPAWETWVNAIRRLCIEEAPHYSTAAIAVRIVIGLSHLQRLAMETEREVAYREFMAELCQEHPGYLEQLGLVLWDLQEAIPVLGHPALPGQSFSMADLQWRDETGNSIYTPLPGDELEIIPGPEVGLGWLNCAPCLLAPMSGDFVLETRITPEAHPRHAGGIVVWQDRRQLLRFASGVDHQGQVSLGWHDGVQFRHVGFACLQHRGLNLKLTRQGIRYEAFFSLDRQRWYTCGHLDFGQAGPVEAGLFAECNYEYGFPQPFPIRFSDFSLWAEHKAALPTPAKANLFPLPETGKTFYGMVGRSRVFSVFCEQVQQVARSAHPLLIYGESGTGKELAAEAVHQLSRHQAGLFVPVNVATLGGELIESELFGHKKGAFTGAVADKTGLFEVAAGGSIFLDEIGDLPGNFQPKLLRVLDKGEIRLVGDTQPKKIDARCLAATNRDLAQAVSTGQFREDLFYRFGQPLEVPPLRERKEDIPHLVAYFLTVYTEGREYGITREAMARLMAHNWPDNVRGLEKVVERAIGRAGQVVITAEHLVLRASAAGAKLSRPAAKKPTSATELRCLLQECNSDISAVSRRCRVNRRTVYRWVERFGLDVAELRSAAGD